MATLGDLVVRIGADTRDLNKELGRVQKTMRGMTSNFTALGQNMTRSITLPIVGIGGAALKSAADLETLETSFISLTGGAEQAANMMQNLNEFTARTPFQIDAVAKSARQLIASGTGVGEVNEQLQFLGDIAATSGSSIDEIAAIFSKVQAKGKVELESLNQLAERGIPIFTALSEATGLPAAELGAGAVSVEKFNEVLKSFTQEGGFASGAMLRLSNTVAGKFSTALDNAKLAAASLGKQLLPLASKALTAFTNLAQKFTQLDDSTKRIAIGVSALAGSFGPMLVIIPKVIAGLTALTSPIALTIGAVGALVVAFVYFWDDIRPLITKAINLLILMYNKIVPLRIAVEFLKVAFVNAGKAIYTAFNAVLDTFSTLLNTLDDLLSGDFSAAWDTLTEGLENVAMDVFNVAADIGTQMVDAVNNAIYAEEVDLLGDDALPTKAEIEKRFHGLFAGTGSAIASGIESGTETAVSATRGLLTQMENKLVTGTVEMAEKIVKPIETVTDQVSDSFNRMAQAFADSVGEQIASAKSLKQAIFEIAKSMIIARLAETKANVLSGASSFAASSGPAAPFVFGATLAGMMALVNSIKIPELATGGLAFGPSMAVIGDNKNARIDPEVIAPLSKLKDMMGGNAVEVYGRISGNDIFISNQRTATSRERYS